MLAHSLLGIALHAAVDGGIDFESVFVDVIVVSVGFAVVFAPIFHVGTQVFAQVRRQTVVVGLRCVVRHVDGFLFEKGQAVVAEVTVVVHL